MSLKHVAVAVGLMGAAGAGATLYSAQPDTLTKVIDGDTIIINRTTHVRLWGIDSPELGQKCNRPSQEFAGPIVWDCGKVAKTYLESFFKTDKTLKCAKKNTDQYGRTVAVCSTKSQGQWHDIGKSMVAAGMAVDYVDYSHNFYKQDQDYARKHKLGVWSGEFVMPWDYRHQQTQTKIIHIEQIYDASGKCLKSRATTDSVHYFECKDWK